MSFATSSESLCKYSWTFISDSSNRLASVLSFSCKKNTFSFFLFEELLFAWRSCCRKITSSFFKVPMKCQTLGWLLFIRVLNLSCQPQQHDLSLVDCVLQHKNLRSTVFSHYREKSNIRHMPRGRPTRRLTKLIDNDTPTFFDRLTAFAIEVSRTSE